MNTSDFEECFTQEEVQYGDSTSERGATPYSMNKK